MFLDKTDIEIFCLFPGNRENLQGILNISDINEISELIELIEKDKSYVSMNKSQDNKAEVNNENEKINPTPNPEDLNDEKNITTRGIIEIKQEEKNTSFFLLAKGHNPIYFSEKKETKIGEISQYYKELLFISIIIPIGYYSIYYILFVNFRFNGKIHWFFIFFRIII